ncbi:MAG: site-2 protease family protein [Rectinemataceae bacterium]
MILNVLLGLLGLSLVVVVHELGHFFAARAAGVEVEAFSIGWGPKLFGFKRKTTEWRVSALPLGGFCKLKGEDSFRRALEQNLDEIPREQGSYYTASPLRRIGIGLAGPAANLVLAVLLFTLAAGFGVTVHTAPNRIILASGYPELNSGVSGSAASQDSATALIPANPADLAGLRSGDRILSINGTAIRDYSDLQETIGLSPNKKLSLVVEREGRPLELTVTPRLDKSSGMGLIGVYAWTDPVIASIEPDSAAEIAGILPGDRIVAAEGRQIANTIDFFDAVRAKPERLEIEVERHGERIPLEMVLSWNESGESDVGLGFGMIQRLVKASNPWQAITMGSAETWDTLVLTGKSIGLLFSGVDVLKAVSGPARITWMIGKTASDGVKSEGANGLVPVLKFLGFLSASLFAMNLLPVPVLDGGQVLMFIVEGVRKRPLKTKTIYRFQSIGTAMIAVLFLVASFSDLLFFTAR